MNHDADSDFASIPVAGVTTPRDVTTPPGIATPISARQIAAPTGTPNAALTAAEILRARAQALARPPPSAPAAETMLEVLEFRLAQETYAIEARFVREVYPLKELTPLPCTPAFVRGIVNIRGRILPVLDLKKFFDLPEEGLTDLHRILVVHGHELELGLLADLTLGLRHLPVKSLQAPPPTLTGIRGDYVKGVTAERLVVLDLGRILSDPKIIVHDEVET